MPKIIEFQEALRKEMIQEGHYFQTVATQKSVVTASEYETGYNKPQDFITEQGETKLWRLVKVGKTAEECKLFGTPTKEILTLRGKIGYENAIETLDEIAAGTNIFTEFFKDVHSCRLPERDYKVKYWQIFHVKMQNELRRYQHKDDIHMEYFLASRCVDYDYGSWNNFFSFGMFHVSSSIVSSSWLYGSLGAPDNDSAAVRPEAIPNRNLLLKMDGCDGSKERPWICVPAN